MHGRAPAVATGIKRTHPTQPVFTYQGDGDLASIGAAEIVHAAMRGEKFTTIFVNNAIYGMTGGQMAPTTLIGQKATTCPLGRTVEQAGMPIRVAEMLSTLDGCVYAERVCVTDIAHLNKAKKDGKRIVAVGTTSVRTLESASDGNGVLTRLYGDTDIFIRPGYSFRFVDDLLTNFHTPESTLLMLVSALAGRDRIFSAYSHAIEERYRFFSYGDAMFIRG